MARRVLILLRFYHTFCSISALECMRPISFVRLLRMCTPLKYVVGDDERMLLLAACGPVPQTRVTPAGLAIPFDFLMV